MERKFKFAVGEYYHVYNRGSDKRSIFLNDVDRDRFIKLLYLANGSKSVRLCDLPRGFPSWWTIDRGETLVSVGAYCLMPNHFHLLLREKIENGITKFMLKLTTGYSMYFNKKNDRTGALFQGAFKAQSVQDDRHLNYLFAYIHLNPVKLIEPRWREDGLIDQSAAKKYLEKYQYSSYPEHIGSGRLSHRSIINLGDFPEYFATYKEFNDFIFDWLNFSTVRGTLEEQR
mgnify:CR=1 FL=1